jgi:hypothetical protein
MRQLCLESTFLVNRLYFIEKICSVDDAAHGSGHRSAEIGPAARPSRGDHWRL